MTIIMKTTSWAELSRLTIVKLLIYFIISLSNKSIDDLTMQQTTYLKSDPGTLALYFYLATAT